MEKVDDQATDTATEAEALKNIHDMTDKAKNESTIELEDKHKIIDNAIMGQLLAMVTSIDVGRAVKTGIHEALEHIEKHENARFEDDTRYVVPDLDEVKEGTENLEKLFLMHFARFKDHTGGRLMFITEVNHALESMMIHNEKRNIDRR